MQDVRLTGLSETKAYTLSIRSPSGNEVFRVAVTGQTSAVLEVSSLNPGFYWLEVYDNTRNRRIGHLSLLKVQ
ncbi:hypothetical protein ACQ86N_04610 [Puia sp. P3]|uniref:hypothetical protein n=1 Tax=Puia sp. P3 TaxID=3423952 RepID=UPI003D6765B8